MNFRMELFILDHCACPIRTVASSHDVGLADKRLHQTNARILFPCQVKEWNDETILSANAMYIRDHAWGPSAVFYINSSVNLDQILISFLPLHCILEPSTFSIGITCVKILKKFCCCLQMNFWSKKLKNIIWLGGFFLIFQ